MNRQLSLITCSNFDRELLALRSSQEFQDVRFLTEPVRCDLAEASWPGLAETVESCRTQGCRVALAGGYCLTRPAKDLRLERGARLHQKSQCFEWLADKDILDRFLQSGAFIVLPGWLARWEDHVEALWPGDPKAAQAHFRETSAKIVLLDTGVHPGLDRELKEFARFAKLSAEVHPAGLDLLRQNLLRVALAARLDGLTDATEGRIAALRQRL